MRSTLIRRDHGHGPRASTIRRGSIALLLTAAAVLGFPPTKVPASGAESASFDEEFRDLHQRLRSATTLDECKSLAFQALPVIDRAIQADDYKAAVRIANLASQAAKKSQNTHALMLTSSRREHAALLVRESSGVAKHRRTLTSRPTDPEANLKVGRFNCFVKDDWRGGLPMLARSSNQALRTLAVAELRRPDRRAVQIALGKAWRKSKDAEEERYGRAMEARAYHWFQQALKQSQNEQQKNEVRSLMAELSIQYLTDLEELSVKAGPWRLGTYGDTGNGKDFKVNGLAYPNGLGLHPPQRGFASVRYRLDGKYETFSSGVGIADHDVNVAGGVVFWVLGDGKVLWRSKPVTDNGDAQYCQVAIKGVKFLELRTQAIKGSFGAHAVWLDPHVSN